MEKSNLIALILIVGVALCFTFILFPDFSKAANIIGANYKNATVHTYVNITNAKPEILSLFVYQEYNTSAKNVTLNAGFQRNITCNATVRDWNGYGDIILVNATLWNPSNTTYGGADDNNSHYTNANCTNAGNGVNYTVNYICNFQVYYYAINGTWNCNATAMDTFNKTGDNQNTTIVLPLYALNLTDGIDYGNVAVEDTSNTQTANITNFGNLPINISVEGYGVNKGDGLAMNCTVNGNISISNERFSITNVAYASKTNLTSSSQLVSNFTVPKQVLSDQPITNVSYWQLYIPPNPAGNCSGFVIFSAQAT